MNYLEISFRHSSALYLYIFYLYQYAKQGGIFLKTQQLAKSASLFSSNHDILGE